MSGPASAWLNGWEMILLCFMRYLTYWQQFMVIWPRDILHASMPARASMFPTPGDFPLQARLDFFVIVGNGSWKGQPVKNSHSGGTAQRSVVPLSPTSQPVQARKVSQHSVGRSSKAKALSGLVCSS